MTVETLPRPCLPRERGYPDLKNDVVTMHLRIADVVEGEWKGLLETAVRDDKMEELFGMRESIRGFVLGWREQLDHFIRLCVSAFNPSENDAELSLLADLQKTGRRIDDFSARVFPRWTSIEDFEYLVAEETALTPSEFAAFADRISPQFEEWLQRDEPRPW